MGLRALGKDDHLVKEIGHTVRRMGNNHDDLALAGDQAEILHQFLRHDAVQSGVRLVKNEKGRGGNELHTDGEPLFLPAGKFGNLLLLSAGKTEGLQNSRDPLLLLLRTHIFGQAHIGGVFYRTSDRILLPHQIVLRDKSDPVFDLAVVTVIIVFAFLDRGLRLLVPGNRVDEGALARPGASEDQYHLSWLHGQIDILQKGDLTERLMGRTFVNLNAQTALPDRIAIDQSGTFKEKAGIPDLDKIVYADLDLLIYFFAVVQNVRTVHLPQCPDSGIIIQRKEGASLSFSVFRDAHMVQAVVHVQETPVSAADVILQENSRKHAVVDQTYDSAVVKMRLLPFPDVFPSYKGKNILRQVLIKPLSVPLINLTLFFIQERILQLEGSCGENLHTALSLDKGALKNHILTRLFLSLKEDQACRLFLPAVAVLICHTVVSSVSRSLCKTTIFLYLLYK